MFDILLNDILEVKFWYTCGNDRALNVRHYQVVSESAGVGINTSLAAANSLQGFFAAELRGAMSVDATFDAVSVQRLTPLPKTVATFSTGAAGVGLLPAAVLPRQVAGLVSLQSAFAGPRNRGRFYMPYPDEGSNDTNGVPNAGYLVLLSAVRQELLNAQILPATVGDRTIRPVIVHRDGGIVTFITQAVARTAWATQRRRQNARF